jgi:hypothetical protein
MILITANRSMKGKDSLEQVMREENTPTSLPVITIGNIDRLMAVKCSLMSRQILNKFKIGS